MLRDSGLSHFGLQIVGAFDINPNLVGTTVEGIPIYHTDEFEERRAKDGVKIGVLTVPINIAQDITDKMVAGGIQAVWNFTPFRIRVPETIVVQNTSLYAHLAVMFNRLNEIIKKVLKKEKYGRGKHQKRVPNTEIFFKGKVSVKYSHVVWMRENYFICSRKIGSNQRRARKKEKTIYECYDLDGNYINVIGTVRDEDDYFCAFMYKETPNMIALGSNDSYPFFSNNVWTVYDKNWKPIFMEKFEQISDSRSDKFIYFTRGYKEDNKGLIAFFSKEGELLFTIRGLKEVMCIEDYYIKIEGFDEKVWFFDFYGNLIFQKKFNYEDTKYNENLVIEKIENGYRVWDLKNRKYTVLEAEEIISKGSYKKFLLDVVKDGKVMLYTYTDDVGFEKLIPGEFVSTEIVYSDKIRVETEEYESIYDFNGNLIATTK